MDETKPATPQHVLEATEAKHEKAKKPRNLGRTIGLIVAAIVIVLVIAAAVYGLVKVPGAASTVRDLAIIALALVTLVIGIFLVVLIFQLQSLIALLRNEIKPILSSTNQTVNTVRGTTTFLSETIVNPAITVASYVSGIRQAVSLFTGRGRKKDRAKGGGNGSSAS